MAGTYSAVYKFLSYASILVTRDLIKYLITAAYIFLGGVCLGQGTVGDERQRRRDNVIEAEEALLQGDTAYKERRFDDAVNFFRTAFRKIPDGSLTASLKDAAKERYAQAAVQSARTLNRTEGQEQALRLLDEVLSPEVFPDYAPAIQLQGKLYDPIRSNPSLTQEHSERVDQVRRLLYKAESSYDLGKFDESRSTYEAVLRLDAYNVAARRGIERASAAIADYADAAYDQTRAELLQQVDAGWELNAPRSEGELSLFTQQGLARENESNRESLEQKLDQIFVPVVDFVDASLEEVIEFLEARSRTLDESLEEQTRGVSFVLNMGAGQNDSARAILSKRISLRLRNVPIRQVLDYVTQQTGTKYRVDAFAVVVQPLSGANDDLVLRQYRVPPNFLSQATSASSASNDPFDEDDGIGGNLKPRLTAREFLSEQGVVFPPGSSATYSGGQGALIVRNTEANQEFVEVVVNSLVENEPVQVIIESKIVRITQDNLEELSADFNFLPNPNGGELFLGGGTVGSGRASEFGSNGQVTAGLRSGSFAVEGDPLGAAIDRDLVSEVLSDGPLDFTTSAPGFFSVLGQLDGRQFSLLLRGLDQKGGTDVVSRPSVITRSGEEAKVEAVQEFLYPTEYEPPEVPDSVGGIDGDDGVVFVGVIGDIDIPFLVTPAHPTAFEQRNLGVTLDVLPTVSADRTTIDLQISPRLDDFIGFINYGSPILDEGIVVTANEILTPVFESIRANTSVVVGNNKTVVIGGLLSERVEKIEDKVPFLGDLPFVGRAFRSEVFQREKEVIMIFVTARIVDPAGVSFGSN